MVAYFLFVAGVFARLTFLAVHAPPTERHHLGNVFLLELQAIRVVLILALCAPHQLAPFVRFLFETHAAVWTLGTLAPASLLARWCFFT